MIGPAVPSAVEIVRPRFGRECREAILALLESRGYGTRAAAEAYDAVAREHAETPRPIHGYAANRQWKTLS